jgi:hypothetical protein
MLYYGLELCSSNKFYNQFTKLRINVFSITSTHNALEFLSIFSELTANEAVAKRKGKLLAR